MDMNKKRAKAEVFTRRAKQGDVVLFHGRLIHGGAEVKELGSSRYALACHYIPYNSENWDRDWPRISFNGNHRIHFENSSKC
ncbi:TPA: hypothetical protein EYN98_10255 [Candidatus Poribacteria bacterium]|jgi:ectoine hydroxylase-related dioxygenase (phytanoyl-CoA dioxygenase family)|nr:hypothetical protein [Candidatus Poribacteria bacterium]HIA66422.1 hypothetical protein [Candidatus Poribacteria bacterium]HIB89571.1 hypothetical protein [Candidatus Poribacteria bacterium]HIC01434.1 hypothetical protein [Candidatus Poribacteria bacterium]HIO78681.1 hypothetical protein [Candidatus Poribacteria bacterium]